MGYTVFDYGESDGEVHFYPRPVKLPVLPVTGGKSPKNIFHENGLNDGTYAYRFRLWRIRR